MYPAAMTILIPRVIVFFVCIFLLAVFCRIFLICHDVNKPVTGCRYALIYMSFQLWVRLPVLVALFGWISHKQYTPEEVDYSEYLGPNWKNELNDHMTSKQADSMLVSNHLGGLFDITAFLTSPALPAFTPMIAMKKIPLFGYVMENAL
jgi:hypothetical protein